MSVTLRQRKKGKKISLYLDFYDKGKRLRKSLKLYLQPEPEKGSLSKEKKAENKKILDLAENIRAQKHLEVQNSIYGFFDKNKQYGSFLVYFDTLTKKKKASFGDFGNWKSVGTYLRKYCTKDISFDRINREWVQGFKEFLDKKSITKYEKELSQNTKHVYFNKLKTALKQAVSAGYLNKNPAEQVQGFKQIETQREFLTNEELQKLVKTECENKQLKTVFLFACLTGLRFSDIKKLVWSEIQHSEEMGYFIRFQQQKTKGSETLPISDQARKMLGTEKGKTERVFKSMKYSNWHNEKLARWVLYAGIHKKITFHCSRHTYATLQLTNGTDIFTVSKMLGHKALKTTQVYARIIDKKKKEATNRIQLDF